MDMLKQSVADFEEKIPAPKYRGYLMSRAVSAALQTTLDAVNDPASLILLRTRGIEIHVREWMPSEFIVPVPWSIKTKKEFEEFEGRVHGMVMLGIVPQEAQL